MNQYDKGAACEMQAAPRILPSAKEWYYFADSSSAMASSHFVHIGIDSS